MTILGWIITGLMLVAIALILNNFAMGLCREWGIK